MHIQSKNPYFSGTCASKNTPLRFASAASAARDANDRTAIPPKIVFSVERASV